MGCSASSSIIHRGTPASHMTPNKSNTYHRFHNHQNIEEPIDGVQKVHPDKTNGDQQGRTDGDQLIPKDNDKLPLENLDTKEGNDETIKSDRHENGHENGHEDPILKKLLGDLKSIQNRSITGRTRNKMKKLQSKIDRYKSNRSFKNDSNVKKQNAARKSLLGSVLQRTNSGALDLDFLVKEVLSGNVASVCPSNAKIVRIFTSSTFTDTEHERNYLMENIYPKLKLFCQQRGYQFQIVDMRWGIRDEATNDHMTTDLCLKELELCKKLSTGPNFVSFLSHKYGYRPCPRTISKEHFEKFLQATENNDDRTLMLRWYFEDRNTLKSLYILQPVGDILSDSLSPDPEKKKKAQEQWWKESGRLRNIISSLAKRLLSKEEARLFLMSVTEIEIKEGILNIDALEDHCLWFKRNIKNIENQKYDNYVKKFRECPSVSEDFKESQELLQNLKEERMSRKLTKENILSYDITWVPQAGVDPEANKEHRNYLTKLGRDFQQQIQDLIEKSIDKKNKTVLNDPLYEEVKQHTLFCQKKCESFSGRDDALKRIQDYVQGDKNDPLVIYGKSGCGKTSIMAKAAMDTSKWTNGQAAVILRFIGTTLSSSDANSLMVSIIHQIQYIFSCPQPIATDNEELVKQFHESLKKGSEETPLVVILDSLDQLSSMSGGRQLTWLMKGDSLPQHTKVILSTLPEKQYVCLPQLQSWIKDDSQFWEVPRLPFADVGGILNQWLKSISQTLTDKQRDIVLQAFNKCPLPLFLKLSFDVACGWHSYSPENVTVLEHTVRDSIKSLFNRTEVKHGKILVSHALGYLTLAENGLSEMELEDILSCDEEVLNDVYMYWTPPIRRLPPLLLVRIKNDLEEYLVNRGSDGVQVIDWYHRQFIEAATEIYCSDPAINKSLYSGLVDYFSGKWSNGIPKPFIDKNGTSGECDRLVTQQPIKFDNEPNLRKLNNLPHLLIKANMPERLKEEVLLNHEFLLTKMKANSVREVLDDFILACETFPKDEAILTVTATLQLSQDALSYDPDQLSAQLIGRLPDLPELRPLIESCRNSEMPYLEADHNVLVRPGGQLLHCIPAHKGEITSFDISSNKMTAVTLGMKDGCVKFWDTLKGQEISEIGGFDDKSEKVQFCDEDRLVAIINASKGISFILTETASLGHSLDMKNLIEGGRMENPFFQVCGTKKSWILFHNAFNLVICDIRTSEKKYSIDLSEEEAYVIDPSIPAAGSDKYVVLSLSTEPSKILAVNLQDGGVQRIDVSECFSESDCYPSAIALCPKTDTLYFSGVENEDLCCYDLLKKELIKIIPGTKQTVCENFRISADGQTIDYIAEGTIKTWDLHLEESKTVITVKGLRLLDVGIVSETIAMTTSPDGNLRIWNHALTFNEAENEVTFDQVNHGSIQEVKFLPNPRYVLFMIGFDPFYWYVYDVTNNEILMELQLTCANPTAFPLGSTHVAIVSRSNKLKLVDLETCSITVVFQGKVNPKSCFLTIKNSKEILTTSYGRRNLKVYDTETGQTIKIIKGISQYISHISINRSESIAIAFTEDDCVLIVDMLQYKTLHVLTSNNIKFCHSILVNQETVQVSCDGTLVILNVEKYIDGNKDDIAFCTVIWNIQQEKVQCDMFDQEYHKRYEEELTVETSADVESATFMQNDQVVLSTHDDHIIRIFSTASGELLKRIIHHFKVPNLLFSPNENLPYFVSWVSSDEENAFCLWRKDTFQKVATFKLDERPRKVALSPSGDVVIGRGNTEGHPITLWKLKNGISDPQVFSEMKYTDIFGKHGYNNKLKMSEKDDDKKDETDPDDDDVDADEVGDADYNDDDFKRGSGLESLCDMYKNESIKNLFT